MTSSRGRTGPRPDIEGLVPVSGLEEVSGASRSHRGVSLTLIKRHRGFGLSSPLAHRCAGYKYWEDEGGPCYSNEFDLSRGHSEPLSKFLIGLPE